MQRPRILCVDDEPNVLHGLRRTLRRNFEVQVAESGVQALAKLDEGEPFAVVCSDFRMPGMDGAQVLAEVAAKAPNTAKILLSGQADLESMMRVVNEGGIHRFLTKPCPKDALIAAFEDCVRLYQLRNSERELLEGTLLGSIRVLSQALSLAAPAAFAHYERVGHLVRQLAALRDEPLDWASEAASRLAGLGFLALPIEVVENWLEGKASVADLRTIGSVPEIGADLLRQVPRLDEVADIIAQCRKPNEDSPWIVWAITAASTYARARSRNETREEAVELVRRQLALAHPTMVEHLEQVAQMTVDAARQEIRPHALAVGMVLAGDLLTETGVLLLCEGSEVTKAALERIRNFGLRFGIEEPVFVLPEAEAVAPV